MEVKKEEKMKTVVVTLYSKEFMLDPHVKGEDDDDFGEALDKYCFSIMVIDKDSLWTVEVDGKETNYSTSDFLPFSKVPKSVRERIKTERHIKDLDMEKYLENLMDHESRLIVRRLRSYAEAIIHIPADEEFDPKKLAIITSKWLISSLTSKLKDTKIANGILYDNNKFDFLTIEGGDEKETYDIWINPRVADEKTLVIKPGPWGYVNKKGEWAIKPTFSKVNTFSEGLGCVRFNDDEIGAFVDKTGAFAFKPFFPLTTDFHDGLAGVEACQMYIDKTGRTAFKVKPDSHLYPFHEGMAIIKFYGRNWNSGIINTEGKFILPMQAGEIRDCSEGMVIVATKFSGHYDILHSIQSLDGSFKGAEVYSEAAGFREGLCLVKPLGGGGYGFINKNDEYVIEPMYYEAQSFSEGLAAVMKRDYYDYIDKTGNVAIKIQAFWARDFHDGLAGVMNADNRKWGVIDKTGTYVIEPQYDDIRDFSEGLAAVRVDDLWGFVDKSGQMVIDPQFSSVTDFKEGLAGAEVKK